MAGTLPQRPPPLLLPGRPVRAARRGKQPALGLRDRRRRRAGRRRKVLREDPEDALPLGENIAPPLGGERPLCRGDAKQRERGPLARYVGTPHSLGASLPQRGLQDT